MNKPKNLWYKNNRPWVTFNTYFDKETGLEIDALEIPGNYIILNITRDVTSTKTHRIVKRTIICRKNKFKQQQIEFGT